MGLCLCVDGEDESAACCAGEVLGVEYLEARVLGAADGAAKDLACRYLDGVGATGHVSSVMGVTPAP